MSVETRSKGEGRIHGSKVKGMMSTMATFTPFSARRRATRLPIPPEPPVTTATSLFHSYCELVALFRARALQTLLSHRAILA